MGPRIGPEPIIIGPGMPCIIGYGPMGIMGYGPMGGNAGLKGGNPMGPDIPMDMFRFPFMPSGGPSMGRIPDGGRMKPGPVGGALEDGGAGPGPMPGLGAWGPAAPLDTGAEDEDGLFGGSLAPFCAPFIALLLLPLLGTDWPLLGPFDALACAS